MAIDGQVCFHGRLFPNPVKLCWCITGPVGSLWSTNQNWLYARLLPMAISIYPVVCEHFCHLLGTQHYCLWPNGRETPPLAFPSTPHAPPIHPPFISNTLDITVVVKIYLKNQQCILPGRVSYETVAINLLYFYSKSCMAIMQHRRVTAASTFQNDISRNTKCDNLVKFSHILY